MNSRWAVIVGLVVLVTISVQFAFAGEKKKMKADPKVVMETSEGTITIELWANKTPKSVENFLRYVGEKFYDGTIFHRVIDGFMIQGGGLTVDMQRKPTHEHIQNEASAELKNDRGTISMARTQDIHSATSQFFINVSDNDFLNHRDNTPQGFGYTVFGKVVDGMDVVDRIKGVKTTSSGPNRDVPEKPVIIESIRLLEQN